MSTFNRPLDPAEREFIRVLSDRARTEAAREALHTVDSGAQDRDELLKREGHKDDSGKVRIELFPGDALFAISQVLTFGAGKYTDRNWEKGMGWGRVFGATMRHLWAWWQGRGPTNKSFVFGDLDTETEMSHLWHAGCCIVFLIAFEMRGVGTDDRPKHEDKES